MSIDRGFGIATSSVLADSYDLDALISDTEAAKVAALAAQAAAETAETAVAADLALTNQDTLDTAADVVLTNADVVTAEASKVAAVNAQTAAEAAYDSFDDRYLGSKTADPTLDNDGSALITGALYFNSSSSVMKVYNGTAWVAAYASLAGSLLVANNLSDVASAATARTNLGVLPLAGGALTGAVTTNSTFDGRDVSVDGAKLDGIEAGATADQTASQITALGIAATSVTGSQASAIIANTAKVTNSTSASDLTSGTLPDGRFPATLPAISGANLTNIPTDIDGLSDGSRAGTNLGLGVLAVDGTTSGTNNVGVGQSALTATSTGGWNTSLGNITLLNNISGSNNTAIGYKGLWFNTANNNTALGFYSLALNTTGTNNTASGYSSLYSCTSGSSNTGLGAESLFGTTTGTKNIGVGYGAGMHITTGSNNTIIGDYAGTTTLADTVVIAAGTTERIKVDASGLSINGTAFSTGGLGNVVEDTTPQLGGNLDTQTFTVDGRDVSVDGAKLDGIATSANNYTHPANHAISVITGLQTALDGKVDDSQVLTDVPSGAVFTDTTYSVGDGGLTQINFTSADNTKLDNIEANATADQTAGEIEAIVNHDNLVGFVADEHIDWSLTNVANIHADNYTDTVYAHPTGAGNLHVPTAGTVGQVLTNTASGTGTWQDAASGTPEGTSILSTGETGGTKYLREDGDGTSSWQAVAGGGIGSFIDTSIAISSDDTALANDDGTANDNVGIGLNCLAAVTSGAGNVAIGDGASTAGTTISGNVCVGQKAGRLHTGHGSVFIGKEAGETATSTSYSVGVGYRALEGDVTTRLTGLYNIGIGSQAGKLISSGTDNIAIGREALLSNATTITGSYNTGIGYQSGYNLSTGQYNVLSGYQAGYGLTAGSYNLCLGWQAGDSITSANYNICLGGKAGAGVVAGANNVLVGHESAKTYNFSNVTAVGFQAGELNQGSDNVFVGYKAGRSETASNKLHIANNSTESLIEGDFSAKTVNINGALTVNGAAVGGAMELISTQTITSAVASVEVDRNFKDESYLGYKLVISNIIQSTTADLGFRLKVDGVYSSTANYDTSLTSMYQGSTSLSTAAAANATSIKIAYSNVGASYGEVTILSSATTTYPRVSFNIDSGNGSSANAHNYKGVARYDTAVSSFGGISLFVSSGTISSGTVSLYGIKG